MVHFSGHGGVVDGKLYLLPYDVDARDTGGIQSTAFSIDELRTQLLELAKLGRVLVLLDACRSGAATVDGQSVAFDAAQLRAALAATNITVLTSSSGSELSRENEAWKHGAFTHVFLEALGSASDGDRNGVLSVTELTGYLARHVPRLTSEQQRPGIEVRFEGSLFAAGL